MRVGLLTLTQWFGQAEHERLVHDVRLVEQVHTRNRFISTRQHSCHNLQDLVRIIVAIHTHVIVVKFHAVTPARCHELAQLRTDFSDHIAVVVDQASALENHLLETVGRCVLL